MVIRFGSCEVQRLNRALVTYMPPITLSLVNMFLSISSVVSNPSLVIVSYNIYFNFSKSYSK